jgi:hypothetical protein
MPQTSANPKPLKIVLCFTDAAVCNHVAHLIRLAQFHFFDSQRLASQPDGAIETDQLLLPSRASRSQKGDAGFCQELLTKEGDGDECLKMVTLSSEELTVESKSAGFFSKRTALSTIGLPISFVGPATVAVPARVADVRITFANSRDRDVFAYALFLHSKGDPHTASTFAGPGTLFCHERQQEPQSIEDYQFQSFVAVVEKQGQCEFQLMPAADGTPHLIATPTADSRASVCSPLPDTCMSLCLPDYFLQGFPDGLNLNHLCVRSTKNARGDFKVRRAARTDCLLYEFDAAC